MLFNRFNQPDIDLETLVVMPRATLSTPADPSALRLPLRWTGVLYGRVRASLAANGGAHAAEDVLKLVMAGADVAMLASELIRNGIGRLTAIRQDLARWMDEHEYASVRQMRGSLSQQSVAVPAVFERAQYVRAVSSLRYLAPSSPEAR